jgi:pimeloyl-ACP methyl ester carboxylesterase
MITDADGLPIHIVEAGQPGTPAIVLLHGWPQSSVAFELLLPLLSPVAHVVALDLPGIGGSPAAPPAGDKRTIARHVHAAIRALELREVTLVGHDIGAMVAYAYLHAYPRELRAAVLLNIAIPGVDPWSETTHNPNIFHFALHAIPKLPETLIAGRQTPYFDYFYDAISAAPSAITPAHRAAYVAAYSRPAALTAGFDWYRAFAQDEKDNQAVKAARVETPVLYMRGDRERGSPLDAYVEGLCANGLVNVEGRAIPNCAHFSAEEQPAFLAAALLAFIAKHPALSRR